MNDELKIFDSESCDSRPCPECGELTESSSFIDVNSDAVCPACYSDYLLDDRGQS